MPIDKGKKPDDRFINRPAKDRPANPAGVPDRPQEKARKPGDPADQDGVQGDEGGGGYPGPEE